MKGQVKEQKGFLGLGSDGVVLFKDDGLWVDSHTLGGVVSFVDADETISDLKHVVPQGNDDELCVLCLLLKEKYISFSFTPPCCFLK